MNAIRLVLLDFDCTLTKTHTSGALCFANDHYDTCLTTDYGKCEQEIFSLNNAADNAALIFQTLLQLVENNLCVSIITCADSLHSIPRQRQLTMPELAQQYSVLAGQDLVIRWLCCIAMRAYNYNYEQASAMLRRLFRSGRFHIVAKFNAQSKQQHFLDSLLYYEKMGTLKATTLRPEQVLYIDDSLPFLNDMQQHFASINIFWAPHGLREATWRELAERFNLPVQTPAPTPPTIK
jgi:hypothetical protein